MLQCDKERLEYGEDRFLAGERKGREETLRMVANNMLTYGKSIEEISAITGLTKEQIEG